MIIILQLFFVLETQYHAYLKSKHKCFIAVDELTHMVVTIGIY